jgi:hypothetical protein
MEGQSYVHETLQKGEPGEFDLLRGQLRSAGYIASTETKNQLGLDVGAFEGGADFEEELIDFEGLEENRG